MKRMIFAAALSIPWLLAAEEAVTGRWMIDGSPLPDRVQLTLHWSRGSGGSTNSFPIPITQLRGLDRRQMDSPEGATLRFEIARDAGTLACEGYFKHGNGAGVFTFSPDATFVSDMRGLGYSGLSQEQIFSMAVHDVSRAYVRGLRSLELSNVPADELIAMRIHNVTLEYIRELQSLGYAKLEPDQLVTMRIHGVETDFIRALNQLGYRAVSPDELVTMRIHGVTPDYIRNLRHHGMNSLSIDQLVSLRIHGIVD